MLTNLQALLCIYLKKQGDKAQKSNNNRTFCSKNKNECFVVALQTTTLSAVVKM